MAEQTQATNQLQQQLNELVEALPKDRQKLVDFLKQQKIRGLRDDSYACPIANYVKAKLRCDNVEVSCEEIIASTKYQKTLGYHHSTTAITEFIDLFDDGQFPELETTNNGKP